MYPSCANTKLQALGETLEKAMHNFQDVVQEMNNLTLNCDKYRIEIASYETKMESKCQSCGELESKLQCKNGVMESVVSALTRLNNTKNLNIITELFNIICQDNTILTPPRDSPKDNKSEDVEKDVKSADVTMFNISVNNESTSEIDGTPTTGRTSPILSKKPKSRNVSDPIVETSKKKCSNTWPTSEKKIIKLLIPTPPGPGSRGGKKKLRQSRIQLSRLRTTQTVDLTSSPELQTDKKQIKKEPITDVNDTILPSPTSGPLHLNFTNKTNCAAVNGSSPRKFRKPSDLLRQKIENKSSSPQKCDAMQVDLDVVKMETSISLLNNKRYKNSPSKLKLQPNKIKTENFTNNNIENVEPANDVDATRVDDSYLFQPPRDIKTAKYSQTFTEDVDDGKMQQDTNVSISILKQIEQFENEANRNVKEESYSPSKMPIVANTNYKKIPALSDTEVSISVLQGAAILVQPQQTLEVRLRDKMRTPEKVDTIYKEPTIRKKAEKRALPGWSCEECKNFYSELYKDDYEMLAKLMDECSKHRGKHNPTRPKTPENFWNPRWDVPDDTEAFNKRNNVS